MFSDNYFNSDHRPGVRFGIGPIEEESECEVCGCAIGEGAEICKDCWDAIKAEEEDA